MPRSSAKWINTIIMNMVSFAPTQRNATPGDCEWIVVIWVFFLTELPDTGGRFGKRINPQIWLLPLAKRLMLLKDHDWWLKLSYCHFGILEFEWHLGKSLGSRQQLKLVYEIPIFRSKLKLLKAFKRWTIGFSRTQFFLGRQHTLVALQLHHQRQTRWNSSFSPRV